MGHQRTLSREELAVSTQWQDRAKCRGQWEMMTDPDREAEARATCRLCPVKRDCLISALDSEDLGIWADTDYEERTWLCPICTGPKPEQWDLACSGPHFLLRLARLMVLQDMGVLDVEISPRSDAAPASVRVNPACTTPRGRSHSTANAHKLGCRCPQAWIERKALRAAQKNTGEAA